MTGEESVLILRMFICQYVHMSICPLTQGTVGTGQHGYYYTTIRLVVEYYSSNSIIRLLIEVLGIALSVNIDMYSYGIMQYWVLGIIYLIVGITGSLLGFPSPGCVPLFALLIIWLALFAIDWIRLHLEYSIKHCTRYISYSC